MTAGNKEWKPFGYDRLCSEYFVDGIPTVGNPNPTLKLESELKQTKLRQTLLTVILKDIYQDRKKNEFLHSSIIKSVIWSYL